MSVFPKLEDPRGWAPSLSPASRGSPDSQWRRAAAGRRSEAAPRVRDPGLRQMLPLAKKLVNYQTELVSWEIKHE